MDSQGVTNQHLVERLLTRIDHPEIRLIRETRSDLGTAQDEGEWVGGCVSVGACVCVSECVVSALALCRMKVRE